MEGGARRQRDGDVWRRIIAHARTRTCVKTENLKLNKQTLMKMMRLVVGGGGGGGWGSTQAWCGSHGHEDTEFPCRRHGSSPRLSTSVIKANREISPPKTITSIHYATLCRTSGSSAAHVFRIMFQPVWRWQRKRSFCQCLLYEEVSSFSLQVQDKS